MTAELPPPAARTLLQMVVGSASPDIEAKWTLPSDSPILTSWTFIDWEVPTAPARASAPRSLVVAAILVATRPPLPGGVAALRAANFLTAEMADSAASTYLHELDKVGAFSNVYAHFKDWVAAVPALWGQLANGDSLRLDASTFDEVAPYTARSAAPPPEVAFLMVDFSRRTPYRRRARPGFSSLRFTH